MLDPAGCCCLNALQLRGNAHGKALLAAQNGGAFHVLGIKKYRYTACRNMPREIIKECRFPLASRDSSKDKRNARESTQRSSILECRWESDWPRVPKVLQETLCRCGDGQSTSWQKYRNVGKWRAGSQISMFRNGLKIMKNDQQNSEWDG